MAVTFDPSGGTALKSIMSLEGILLLHFADTLETHCQQTQPTARHCVEIVLQTAIT